MVQELVARCCHPYPALTTAIIQAEDMPALREPHPCLAKGILEDGLRLGVVRAVGDVDRPPALTCASQTRSPHPHGKLQ